MAVELYKQGTIHTRNGIKCEAQIFNEYSFMSLLDAGWFLTPEEVYEKKPAESKPVGGENHSKKKKIGRPRKARNDNES